MIVGITGGIGAGKSICTYIFEELGIPAYSSDQRAKSLMITDQAIIDGITQLFGEESYLEDGTLNRSHLSNLIFKDSALLKSMNEIVHPAVRKDFMDWAMDNLQRAPYVIQESALLFETGSYKIFSKTILVDAPVELRISRVMARDLSTREQVMDRMSKQLPSAEKRKLADY